MARLGAAVAVGRRLCRRQTLLASMSCKTDVDAQIQQTLANADVDVWQMGRPIVRAAVDSYVDRTWHSLKDAHQQEQCS